ncbi:DUF1080 domain-containing protein [Sphingomonas parva]|uniref:DUF1080 domain-containing protein n=1 Tax=Sphingomonas parva TaxID=2555898 RepID=A0A4Y8ZQ95_9SPHN|nr:DUF1080 domain-containing protein [Sphingomonas parva]TFI57315.1 DUF1080 domain-containing protein [Sphingomonas parva]
MRHLTTAALLLLVAAATPAAAKPGWQRIFDGRSLAGWTPKITGQAVGVDPARTFRVKDGAIAVSYEDYGGRFAGRFGHLAFKRPVGAFRLRLDYRFTGTWLPDVEGWQHSNSGIMVLGQDPATMARDQKFPVSIEVQLLGPDGPLPASGNLCTPGTNVVMAGRLETEHCIRAAGSATPYGRWMRAEIEVTRDGRITHWIGGKKVLSYSEAQLDPADPDARPLIAAAGGTLRIARGWLYLQSEGHPVEFRNIALMELD